jgi:formate-dependent nitrite reductase membrane component NrfD
VCFENLANSIKKIIDPNGNVALPIIYLFSSSISVIGLLLLDKAMCMIRENKSKFEMSLFLIWFLIYYCGIVAFHYSAYYTKSTIRELYTDVLPSQVKNKS